jgi:hypothetical protein
MRRIWATLLLALFGFSPIIPALSAGDSESTLPACCRRNGAHHCAILKDHAKSGGETKAEAARCPSFPSAKAFPVGRTAAAVNISQRIVAVIVSHPAARPRTEALYRISYSRAGQKRGPPLSELVAIVLAGHTPDSLVAFCCSAEL